MNKITIEIIDNIITVHYDNTETDMDKSNCDDQKTPESDGESSQENGDEDFYPNGEPRTHKGYLKSLGIL